MIVQPWDLLDLVPQVAALKRRAFGDCHYRAKEHAARGVRERLVAVARAPGEPFDHGRFEIVQEPLTAPDPGAALDPVKRVALGSRRSLPVVE